MDEETATGQAPRESPVPRGLADMTAGEILRWAAVLAVLGYPGAENPGSAAAPAPDPLPTPLPTPFPAPAPPSVLDSPVPARPPQPPVPPGVADPDADADAIERIRALEVLKSAACAAQARIAAGFDASQRARQAAAGIPANRRGLGVGAQLGLARRESPHRGRTHLGLARVLVQEMPRTLAALSCGALSEWGATVLARESACLSRADRAALDERLCADPSRLEGVGERALAAAARRQACALDPASVADRARRAVAHRTVTCRPAPDAMVYLTALLPVRQGVAVLAELAREAGRAAAGGDRRGRGQVMADTLVARATGRRAAAASDVEVQLVVTDRTLFQGDAEPAYLAGYGIVPAQWARDLVRDPNGTENTDGTAGTGPDPGNTAGFGASGARARRRERWRPPVPDPPGGTVPPDVPPSPASGPGFPPPDAPGAAPDAASDPAREARVWLRRLYTSPTTGQLIAMDSRARIFPEGIRRLLAARDRTCRTPWCDAPLRHHDHVVPVRSGGPTSAANGEGLCEACNYAKEAPGWAARTAPGPRHTIEYTTPTGHAYTGTAPPLPGTPEAGSPTGELLVHGSFAHTMLLQHLKTDKADEAC